MVLVLGPRRPESACIAQLLSLRGDRVLVRLAATRRVVKTDRSL